MTDPLATPECVDGRLCPAVVASPRMRFVLLDLRELRVALVQQRLREPPVGEWLRFLHERSGIEQALIRVDPATEASAAVA